MVSDEELEAITSTDVEKLTEEYCKFFCLDQSTIPEITRYFRNVLDIAQELLQRRQADLAVWENAPDWANWYARDKNGQGYFYEKKPWACVVSWRYPGDGRVAPIIVQSWRSTLQERPK